MQEQIVILNPDAEVTLAGCTFRAAILGYRAEGSGKESIEAIIPLDAINTPKDWRDAWNATKDSDLSNSYRPTPRFHNTSDPAKLNTFKAELAEVGR